MDHISRDTVERIAALLLVVMGAIFTVRALRMRSVQPGSTTFATDAAADGTVPSDAEATAAVRRSLVIVLAGLSAGAAVIHLAAAPSHYAELGDLAAGFVVAAAFQGAWIRWCLAGPSRMTMAMGIAGNIAIVAAWTWTRTVGLPVGEFAGSAEPVGYPDAAAVAFELLLVGGLVIRWLSIDVVLARRSAVRAIASVAVVPVVGLVLLLTSIAALVIASGLDHARSADGPAAERVATP
jgi:hypothetical protein